MATNEDSDTLTEEERIRAVVRDELSEQDTEATGGRRDFLQALGLGGLAAGMGGGAGYATRSAVEPASAQSTSDSVGDVGTPSDPVDVFAAGISADEVSGERRLENPAWSDVTSQLDAMVEDEKLVVTLTDGNTLTVDAQYTLTKAVNLEINGKIEIASGAGGFLKLGDANNQIHGGRICVNEIDGQANNVTAVEFFNVTALQFDFDLIQNCQGFAALKWDADSTASAHPDAWKTGSGENMIYGGYIRECANAIKSTTVMQWMEGNVIEVTIFDCGTAGIHCQGQFTKNEFYGVSDNRDAGAMDLIDNTTDYNWYYMKFFQTDHIEFDGPIWLAYQGKTGASGYQVHPDQDDRALSYAGEFYEIRANSIRNAPGGSAQDSYLNTNNPAHRLVVNQSADLVEVAQAGSGSNPVNWNSKFVVDRGNDVVRSKAGRLRADYQFLYGSEGATPTAPPGGLCQHYVSDGTSDVAGADGDEISQTTNSAGTTKEYIRFDFSAQ